MIRLDRHRHAYRSPLALLLGAGVVAIFMVATTAEQIRIERESAFDVALTNNRSRAQVFQEYVLRTLEVGDVATEHVASRLATEARSTEEAAEIIGSSILSKIGYAEGTIVVMPDGARVESGVSLPDSSWRQLERFARLQSTDVAISPPVRTAKGEQLLVLSRRLGRKGGQGFIGIAFEPHHLTDFSRDVRFETTDLVSLIGLDGITRARREGDNLSTGENLAGRLVMQRQHRMPNGSYYGPSSLDGKLRIFSHRRIERYGLFATSGVSMESTVAKLEARRRFHLLMLAAAIVAIVTAACLLVIGMGQRRRRLAVLSAANFRLNEAQRIGEMGDWDYLPGSDELVWSDNLCALYGRDCSERVSTLAAARDYVNETDFRTIRDGLEAVVRTGEPGSWDIVTRLHDGRRSHRRIIAAPVRDKAGRVTRIHGVNQPIDQERHLAQLQEQVAAHARLDSMNALAATLAHELNQPLGVAANFLAAARRRLGADPTDTEGFGFLDEAEEQIVTVAEIIGAARQALSGRPGDRVRFSIAEAVDRVRILVRGHPAEDRATIEVRIDPEASEAAGNVALVKQVLHNLVRNALEAIPEGRAGRIVISTAPDKGDRVRVCVSDNGGGMEEGVDPFTALSTLKEEGLGLGLALSRTIIEAQGGKIWVETTSKEGTTVAFSLLKPS